MTTLQDLQTALLQVTADIQAEKATIADNFAALNKQISDLHTQVANGSGVNSSDLDSLMISIQGIDAQVKNMTEPTVSAASITPAESAPVVEPAPVAPAETVATAPAETTDQAAPAA